MWFCSPRLVYGKEVLSMFRSPRVLHSTMRRPGVLGARVGGVMRGGVMRGRRRLPQNQRAAEHLNSAVVLPTALDRRTAPAQTTHTYRGEATRQKTAVLKGRRWPRELRDPRAPQLGQQVPGPPPRPARPPHNALHSCANTSRRAPENRAKPPGGRIPRRWRASLASP